MESSSMDVVYGHVSHLPPSTLKQARWKSMSGLELSGYINVKVPLKERRFGSWKAWRRQWCVISRSGNSVSLQISSEKENPTFSILIPEDAILCRTESRSKDYAFGIFRTNRKHREAFLYLAGESETDSQKWMANIRCLLKPPMFFPAENEFEIALVDNCHSREAGLTGLYGLLSLTSTEIVIKDQQTGKIKVTWHWSQISHSYLPLPANSEDVHRVCTVRTSSQFKAGEGELEIFCLQADKLHEKMSSCPRLPNIPRIVTQPLPPTPDMTPPRSPVSLSRNSACPSPEPVAPSPLLLSSRRMSRSENDLQKFFFQRSLNNLRHNSSQELILLSNENLGQIRKAPSLLFANIGFLISTPGGSEAGSMNDVRLSNNSPISMRSFQDSRFEYGMIDEEDVDHSESVASTPTKSRRKFFKQHSNVSNASGDYEEIPFRGKPMESDCRSPTLNPPPLPPRKSTSSTTSQTSTEEKDTNKSYRTSQEYLPMTTKKKLDQKYTPMANLKDKILVSGPIPI